MNSFDGGGAERVCLNLAEQLYEYEIESDFIIVYDKKADYDIPDYIHVFSLGLKEPFLTRFSIVVRIPAVNRFIFGKKYVLITAHLQPAQQVASYTRVGNRCLYVMHGSQHLEDKKHSWYYKQKLWRFLNKRKVITVSEGLREELNVEYGISSQNITTIYNPCRTNVFEIKEKRGILRARPYILVMGRLEEEKNPCLALDLYSKGRFYYKFDLIFLGKGSLEEGLKKRINELNLQEYVFLAGFQKQSELWLINAALLLICSKQEGLPMSIVEALAIGIPVVSVDCPYGPREILTGELARYLIYPDKQLERSLSVISSALEFYPPIKKEYYAKFEPGMITKTYLSVWKKYFET